MKLPNPFGIEIQPMKRLLLVNFEKDPDSIYVGFEPQVFDDPVHGKGHLVIGWRKDGKVDVYHEPSLTPDPEKFDIAGKGLANLIELEMPKSFYEINDQGVQARYSFRDLEGRQVDIRITEKNPKKRKPFGLLAPLGEAAEAPSAMPLVFLHDFYFVRKEQTEFVISIDGKHHQPDELPLPMDMTKMYFTRYSPNPLIATFNPAFSGTISTIEVEIGEEKISSGDSDIDLRWRNEKAYIKQITRRNEVHPVKLVFEDPFPDIKSLETNKSIRGEFTIEADPSTGCVKGQYFIDKRDTHTKITMILQRDGNHVQPSFLFFFFTLWPRSLRNGPLLTNGLQICTSRIMGLSLWNPVGKESDRSLTKANYKLANKKTDSMENFKRIISATVLCLASLALNAQVIFEEHFEGDRLNMEHWNYEEGDGCPDLCGWGNNERKVYDREFVEVKDGNLVITAVKKGGDYYSGKINTMDKVEFQYGEVEIRAKLPEGEGLWPAIWMLGYDIAEVGWPASGEIDIMEYVGREPHIIHTSLHTPASHGNTINTKKTKVEDIEEGFHTYKTVWKEDFIEFYIDGESVYKFMPEKFDAEHYPYRKPFYFLINMAIGGNFGGPEVDDSIFPAQFHIDYIKVTEL